MERDVCQVLLDHGKSQGNIWRTCKGHIGETLKSEVKVPPITTEIKVYAPTLKESYFEAKLPKHADACVIVVMVPCHGLASPPGLSPTFCPVFL